MKDDLYGYMGIAFVFGFLVLITVLLAVMIVQWFKTKHLKMTTAMEVSRDEKYRSLSESTLDVQQQLKVGQEQLLAELVQLRTRTAAIEKLLREVD